MLKMKCSGVDIHIPIDQAERLSMIVAGNSRMGKTFFVSLLGAMLIHEGNAVHLIDLGKKWYSKDKERLEAIGARRFKCTKGPITLAFTTPSQVVNCSRYIATALGFKSNQAKSVIKNIFQKLLKEQENWTLLDVLQQLETYEETNKEWAERVFERFGYADNIPDIQFCVNAEKAKSIMSESTIWDLDGLEDICVKVMAQLILYCIFCVQCSSSMNLKSFVIIDEVHNLDCNQDSIIGTCLVEGQKHQMFLVLITQFLQNKFSDAVIKQFKQGGYRIYFRLTEEEAAEVSGQLMYTIQDKKELYRYLTTLPRGRCLFVGSHMIGNCEDLSEKIRFIDIIDE